MFWLATLNPGRKTRKRRLRRRRKLSAWQRMVKKYGGVMQAVRAKRKSGRGRRRRKNPFLTQASSLMTNARRKRRSARRRRLFRRGRPRRNVRRSVMAVRRRRRRRTPPRGRGGRFVSRGRRGGRRRRRNPVVPVSWNPRRRRRRGSRRRRNPLFLSKKGFSGRKHRGYRQMHRRRRRPHYWHNPVVPVSWNRRRRRRHYRRNAVLPGLMYNPIGALTAGGGPIAGVIGRAKSLVDVSFWTQTALPAAAGFIGSKVTGGFIYGFLGEKLLGVKSGDASAPFVRLGSEVLGGASLSWAIGRFYNRKAGEMVWLGTVVNVAYSLLKQLLGGTSIGAAIGLSGLGEDLSSRMRDAVARRVEAELSGMGYNGEELDGMNGMGAYMTVTDLQRQRLGEYVTDNALRMQPSYAPTPKADLRDYDVTRTETDL